MNRIFDTFIVAAALACVIPFFANVEGANGNIMKCNIEYADLPKDWPTMKEECNDIVKDQIQIELNAAMTYLSMAAHFSRDTVNRPGFAKFFFESASEERQHAIKLIDYLTMRGKLTTDFSGIIKSPKPVEVSFENGVGALTAALELETNVTESIQKIIELCENPKKSDFNDYHIVDWLIGEYLEEQYRGQRDLAGKISTLGKMMTTHKSLGEFLFDKKILNGELLHK